MRKAIALAALLISLSAYCQNTQTVGIDFKTKDVMNLPAKSALRKADFIKIHIVNLPANKYKVSVNKTDSVISIGQPPALFGALTFGDGYSKLLANLSDYGVKIVNNILKPGASDSGKSASNLTEAGNTQAMAAHSEQLMAAHIIDLSGAIKPKPEDVYYMVNAIHYIKAIASSTESNIEKQKDFKTYIFDDQRHYDLILRNLDKLVELKDFYDRNPAILAVLNQLKSHEQVLNDSVANELKVASLISRMTIMRSTLFEFYFKFKDLIVDPADQLILSFRLQYVPGCPQFVDDANTIILSKNQLIHELESAYKNYFDDILPNYDLVIRTIPLSKSDSMIQKFRKDFYTIADRFDSVFNTKLMADACDKLNVPSEFTSLPYSINGDATKISLSIEPLTGTNDQNYSTDIFIPRHVTRNWSFSSGIYLSGMAKKAQEWSFKTNLQQQANSNPPVYDTLNYSLVKESKSSVEAGIDALLNINFVELSPKVPSLGLHFGFGPGLSLESKPKPRLIFGAGLVYGEKNQVLLTAGWIGGPVRNLSDAYDSGIKYPSAAADIMKDKFRGSWMVSLSYSIL